MDPPSALSPHGARGGSRTRRRSRLIGPAFAIALTFLLAEGALRTFFPQVGKLRQLVVSTDDERGFIPRPDTRIPFEGVFSPLHKPVVWQTNSEGLRHEGPVTAPSKRFRVVAYGDSETFGWSVALDETFERQMERIDPRVEVLNLGVPGYNVSNIREHMEQTIPRLRPDLAIYLVNKNDFNEAVNLTALSNSHVLLHLRFLVHFSIGKQRRLAIRDSAERTENFAREVDRMTHILEARGRPLLLGFLKWKNREALGEYALRAARAAPTLGRSQQFRLGILNIDEVVDNEPKEDTHYVQSAHRKMAARFCREISGGAEDSCVPPGWQRTPGAYATAGSQAMRSR
jgi:hypothetical protein